MEESWTSNTAVCCANLTALNTEAWFLCQFHGQEFRRPELKCADKYSVLEFLVPKHTEYLPLLWKSWKNRTSVFNISEDLEQFLDDLLPFIKLTPTLKVSWWLTYIKKRKRILFDSTEFSLLY